MRWRMKAAIAGAIVGFLDSCSIWFVPSEPYANFIVAAGTLKGLLTALLISCNVDNRSSLRSALGVGALYGFLMSAVVFLAKGGWASWDAPYVVPAGLVVGLILGPLVRWLNRPPDLSGPREPQHPAAEPGRSTDSRG
jgi:predicted ABC-type sugar transport system permease subunit